MLNFPEKTRCNRRLPKEKFYEHLPMTAKLERAFIDGIASIKLVNVISPETMNITASDGFSEIGVIEIALKTFPVNEFVLETDGTIACNGGDNIDFHGAVGLCLYGNLSCDMRIGVVVFQ